MGDGIYEKIDMNVSICTCICCPKMARSIRLLSDYLSLRIRCAAAIQTNNDRNRSAFAHANFNKLLPIFSVIIFFIYKRRSAARFFGSWSFLFSNFFVACLLFSYWHFVLKPQHNFSPIHFVPIVNHAYQSKKPRCLFSSASPRLARSLYPSRSRSLSLRDVRRNFKQSPILIQPMIIGKLTSCSCLFFLPYPHLVHLFTCDVQIICNFIQFDTKPPFAWHRLASRPKRQLQNISFVIETTDKKKYNFNWQQMSDEMLMQINIKMEIPLSKYTGQRKKKKKTGPKITNSLCKQNKNWM